ncbi:hypothetical protein CWE12_01660 [Aliidiomarina sedimenti]|uniref:DNA polymerase III subunit delta' n=1 Tax=Aliidiomarina sedimenti TaxID=1933879 RepID=A0ABY0C1Q5_9GAMM|nr:DNA polymerase III subunit delta' [Aliidiomarina sedimenti]RUO31732.1 hypothetical protein CWE12_01660 [Aliidiomarina sedimenti]
MKLPWLRATWQALMQAAQNQRLSHGLAIIWNPQLGSDRLLDQLSQWLLCQHSQGQMKACGQCKSCLLWRAQGHPDYHRIGDNDDSSIGVDAIRQLQQRLSTSANQGGHKVAVIAEAEKLTVAAANALLKTLEEPPAATTIIVASRRYQALLPTIRSRLQYYPVTRPGITQLAQWLTQYGEQPVNATETLRVWCDAPLTALERLGQGTLQSANSMARVVGGETPDTKSWANKEGALGALDEMERLLRDTLCYQQTHNESLLIDADGLMQSGLVGDTREPVATAALNDFLQQCHQLRARLRQQSGLNTQLAIQQLLNQLRQLAQR